VIVTTGPRGGVVQVSSISGGKTFLIGPGTTVLLEAGKPIQVLEWTPGATWPTGDRREIVTPSVFAARG
jgi:hypothetical protein